MKKLIISTAVALASLGASAATVPVILTAGQSNTDGRIPNADLPAYITSDSYAHCQWSYCNGTKDVTEGTFEKFWPRMSSSDSERWAYDAVTYYFLDKALGSDFYVIKQSYGGTSIDPNENCSGRKDDSNNMIPEGSNGFHWSADPTWLDSHLSANKDGDSLLKALEDNIDACIEAINADGNEPDFKVMLWHQGESDKSSAAQDAYYDNLKAVVEHVRQHLVTKTGDNKYATLPFICGTVPHTSSLYKAKVEEAQLKLSQDDANFYTISLADGVMLSDNKHFDATTAERFGKQNYNLMVDKGLVADAAQKVSLTTGASNFVTTSTATLHTIGDSTVSKHDQTSEKHVGQYGWGEFVGDYLVNGLTSKNWADSGETAKSYYGKYWSKYNPGTEDLKFDGIADGQTVKDQIKEGDYVLIQFGHNDSKSSAADPVAEYKEYLGKLASEISELGATPIIVSSVCRKDFDTEGKLTNTGKIVVVNGEETLSYPSIALQYAADNSIASIDLNTATATLMESVGAERCNYLFPAGQTSHTNELGGRVNAILALNLLKEANILSDYIDAPADASVLVPAVSAPETGDEKVVTEATTWTFNNCTVGEISTAVTEINNMYVRGGSGSQAVKAEAKEATVKFEDDPDTEISITNWAVFAGNDIESSVTSSLSAGAAGPNRCIAVNVGVPGKFAVIYDNTAATSGRTAKLFFNGEKVGEKPVTKNIVTELNYTASTKGTFYFGSQQGFHIYAVKFTPYSEDKSEDEFIAKTLDIPAEGYTTFSNHGSFNILLPPELKAYAVHHTPAAAKAPRRAANVAATVTDENGTLELVEMPNNIVPSNQAAIVAGAEGTYNLSQDDLVSEVYSGDNKLVAVKIATTPAHEIGDGTYAYTLAVQDGKLQFAKADGNTTVGAGQAYLQLPYSAETVSLTAATDEPDPEQPADDPTKVSKETTWTADDFYATAITDSNNKVELTGTQNKNGLYLVTGDDVKITIEKAANALKKVTIGEDEVTVNNIATLAYNQNFGPTAYFTADAASTNRTKNSAVITTTVAGTFTVVFRPGTTSEAERYAKLYFIPEGANKSDSENWLKYNVASTSLNSELNTASFTADGPGTFAFGGNKWSLYAAKFVPANLSTGIEDIEVNEEAEVETPWYNLQGVPFMEQPTVPGIYIHNGKKILVR